MWVKSIEYAIEYPPQVTWLGDDINDAAQLKLGSSPTTSASGGIAITWTSRGNGYQPLLIQTASVLYDCEFCTVQNIPIVVVQKPTAGALPDGLIRIIRSPDDAEIGAVGMTSYLCATVPVEETTWGNIKALYNN
jgi:hypothetical protein